MQVYIEVLYQRSEVSFLTQIRCQTLLSWTRVSAYPCVVKQLANPGRWFTCVFIVTGHSAIEVLRRYFNGIEPACGRVNNCPSGQTKIITNDSDACLMLSYRLTIWPIGYICTESRGFSYALILGGRCLQIAFLFLNHWHILHGLATVFLRAKAFPIS